MREGLPWERREESDRLLPATSYGFWLGHGLEEARRREDKLAEYLAVWDRREGWVNGEYDGRQEWRLKEISRELKRSISTVANRYQSAFGN